MLSIHRSRWVTLLHQSKKSWNKRNPLSQKQPFWVMLPASLWSGWITNNKLRSKWQNTVKNGCPIPGYQIVKSKQTTSFRIVESEWIWRFSTAFGPYNNGTLSADWFSKLLRCFYCCPWFLPPTHVVFQCNSRYLQGEEVGDFSRRTLGWSMKGSP